MTRLEFGLSEPPTGPPVKMAYVGRASCGHVRALIVDGGSNKDAHTAGGWARDGLVVERIPLEDARGQLGGCDVCRPPDAGLETVAEEQIGLPL